MGGANLEDGVRLTGASADPVEVVLAADGGELSGHVMGRNSEPVSKAVVALVPELPSQRGRGDLYRVASSDSAGTFRLMSIPPGRYKLFAWEQAAPGAWQSPQFLQPYDELGKSIEVGASSKQEIEVAVLPIRK
jgi:hypothetical protein